MKESDELYISVELSTIYDSENFFIYFEIHIILDTHSDTTYSVKYVSQTKFFPIY